MISFMPGPPPIIYEVGSSISAEYRPYAAAYAEDDPALTAWGWAERQRQQWLSYADNIQRQIDALRAKLVALEREQKRVLALNHPVEDNISLPLNVVRTIPARVIGRMESSFYLYGPESEE